MTHILTIFLCLIGAGLVIGYLGMTGDMGGITWAGVMTIGTAMIWGGALGAMIALFVDLTGEIIGDKPC